MSHDIIVAEAMNMLSEKISLLMKRLDADSGDIAQIAGFDRSNVSRLRSGARVPSRNGSSIRRFANAVVIFSEQSGERDVLCETVGCGADTDNDKLCQALLDWLYDDSEVKEVVYETPRTDTGRIFGKKLRSIMELAEVSNINLSKAVNIDPSYLSKMRSGGRMPNERSKVLERICEVLARRIEEKKRTAELAALADMPPDIMANGIRRDMLIKWLLEARETSDRLPVRELIGKIAEMSFDSEMPIPELPDSVFADCLRESAELYHGIEGLRSAVVRFLSETLRNNERELLLYSDQSMEWMSGDYHIKWLALMGAAMKSGVRIKIIHNIERSSAEMLEAVASWLPLYMSGLIEPYYCTKRLGERFSHTLFLNPAGSFIEGMCVRDFDEYCDYRYISDSDAVALRRMEFDSLLECSRLLVKIDREIRPPDEKAQQLTMGKVQLYIENNTAFINKLSGPDYCFQFDHPVLVKAFREFM